MRHIPPAYSQPCSDSLPIRARLWAWVYILLVAVVGCGTSNQELQIEVRDNGLQFLASNPIQTIELHEDGHPLWTHRLPVPAENVYLPWDWEAGQNIEVRALTNQGWVKSRLALPSDRPPFELRVEAPLGQTVQTVSPDASIAFPLIDGGTATVALRVQSIEGGDVFIRVNNGPPERLALIRNQEHLHLIEVRTSTSISLMQNDFSLDAQIDPLTVTQEELSEEMKSSLADSV